MSFFSVTLLVLIVAGAVLWLARRQPRRTRDAVEDPDLLREAEDEVRDLNAFATPEDAEDDLPDWGPGVPKH